PAPVPADRSASRTERPPIRWIAAGALAAAGLAALALSVAASREWLARTFGLRAAPSEIRSVAVLPFQNLTGDAGQEYFVDGITDALITDLAQVHALNVISRTSVMQYKGAKKTLPEVARELGVDAVLEGSVARSGDRVRVTAQLVDDTDRHLWAAAFERQVRDVLVLQAELARTIVDAVRVEIRPDERSRLARARTVRPEAYDAYLRGRYEWSRRSPESVLKAIEHFQAAIAIDPAYAPAYSGLSDTYRLFNLQGLAAPAECMPKAEAAARKALALDDTLAEAHASLAGVLYRYRWEWQAAEREFRRSLELEPNYAEGHRAWGMYLAAMRRPEEALVATRRALELSPLSLIINREFINALRQAGRYDAALQQIDRAREVSPRGFALERGHVYASQGDWTRAIAALEKGSPDGSNPWLGYGYAVTGRRRDALKVLAAIERDSRQRYMAPQLSAIILVGLGQRERALALLEKAVEQHNIEVPGFTDAIFELLHDEPRYRALLRRMGLADREEFASP
ncbi:MAG: TPR end-of-group domain-containing protein, partial [Vicinamibacterales bacterium]